MNFIPITPTRASATRAPPGALRRLVATLMRHGILAKLRNSAGQDIEGGCGQLRARVLAGAAAPLRRVSGSAR